MDNNVILLFAISAVIFFFSLLYFIPINLWITAIFSGVKIELSDLVFMRIRKTPLRLIVENLIMLTKAGVHVTKDELETHFIAGGDVHKTSIAVVEAKTKGFPLTFAEAAQIDLSGEDVMDYENVMRGKRSQSQPDIRNKLSDIILNDLDEENLKKVAEFVSKLL